MFCFNNIKVDIKSEKPSLIPVNGNSLNPGKYYYWVIPGDPKYGYDPNTVKFSWMGKLNWVHGTQINFSDKHSISTITTNAGADPYYFQELSLIQTLKYKLTGKIKHRFEVHFNN